MGATLRFRRFLDWEKTSKHGLRRASCFSL
jgi:hypothetical protein